MKKIIFYSLVALLFISCGKDDNATATFQPGTFVFEGDYINEEVQFFRGDSCGYNLDSARAYVESIMSADSFDTRDVLDSLVWYEPTKADVHWTFGDSAQVFSANVIVQNGKVMFMMEMEPGMTLGLMAYGNWNAFHFIYGILGVYNPNENPDILVQGGGTLEQKSFEKQEFPETGFQLGLFYDAPYIKL